MIWRLTKDGLFCRGRRSFCLNYYTRKYPVDDAYARPIGPDVVSAILICSRHGTQRCKTNLITLIFVLLFLRILLKVRIIEKVPSILGVRKNALQLDCINEDTRIILTPPTGMSEPVTAKITVVSTVVLLLFKRAHTPSLQCRVRKLRTASRINS